MTTARPSSRRGRRGSRAVGLLSAAVLGLGVATVPVGAGTASATSASSPVMFGAAGPSRSVVEDHERVLGGRLNGLRVYKAWDQRLFGSSQRWARDSGHTLFMSVNTRRRDGGGASWRRIADARPGDALYTDMVRQALEVKAFRARVYLAFHHEPEARSSWKYGSGADFTRAWRNWVSVFRRTGVSNV